MEQVLHIFHRYGIIIPSIIRTSPPAAVRRDRAGQNLREVDAMGRKTDMQARIYDTIVRMIQEQGYAPSVREIGDAVGLKSPSTVHFHLKKLEEAGLIEKGACKGRAISLPAQRQGEAAVENRVPLVGSVAAGSPILAQECIEDYITFDTAGRSGEYFALRVRGMSMVKAGILPGDLVIVHQQSTARSGEIVVALIGEEATVKRLRRENGEIWLLPENDDYQPIDGSEAEILGRVTAVIRQY